LGDSNNDVSNVWGYAVKTMTEWFNWGMDKYDNGLVGVEQAYKHSMKDKICADCTSDKQLSKHKGIIVLNDYYLCKECENYWENKK